MREGELVEVDGSTGAVRVGIAADEAADTNRRERERRAARAASRGPGRTADGHPVALLLNIGDAAGAAEVATVDAEGVGLFRTEFLYLDRQDAPSVDEQVALYSRASSRRWPAARSWSGRSMPGPTSRCRSSTRTTKKNPALGVRGLRTARRTPEVLADQLDALALAQQATGAVVWVMAPMVATAAETKWFTDLAHAHGLPDRRRDGRDPGGGAAGRPTSSSTPTS